MLLYDMLGGNSGLLPGEIFGNAETSDPISILKKLEKVGYIHLSEDGIDIERTVRFLISSLVGAEIPEVSGGRAVFQCEKLIIAAERDRLSAGKLKLAPLKDVEMLEEYLRENGGADRQREEDEK